MVMFKVNIRTKSKIFFGNFNGTRADVLFNNWLLEHSDILIREFRYQQARYGDHSIAILYEEYE